MVPDLRPLPRHPNLIPSHLCFTKCKLCNLFSGECTRLIQQLSRRFLSAAGTLVAHHQAQNLGTAAPLRRRQHRLHGPSQPLRQATVGDDPKYGTLNSPRHGSHPSPIRSLARASHPSSIVALAMSILPTVSLSAMIARLHRHLDHHLLPSKCKLDDYGIESDSDSDFGDASSQLMSMLTPDPFSSSSTAGPSPPLADAASRVFPPSSSPVGTGKKQRKEK